MPAFIDTNVFIHFLLAYDRARFERCRALLARAEAGEIDLETSAMVIAELVWFLERPPLRLSPVSISDRLLPLIGMRGLRVTDSRLALEALATHRTGRLNFVDSFNAAVVKTRKLDRIYSYDTDFDSVNGITRVEP